MKSLGNWEIIFEIIIHAISFFKNTLIHLFLIQPESRVRCKHVEVLTGY